MWFVRVSTASCELDFSISHSYTSAFLLTTLQTDRTRLSHEALLIDLVGTQTYFQTQKHRICVIKTFIRC